MENIEICEAIPVKGSYDMIVAGGGVAGVAAALAGARAAKHVLLIEKTISLGGLATIGLVNLFVPMCNGRGTQIIKGMAEEFLRLSVKYGFDTIPEEWKDGEPGEGVTTRYVTKFSPAIFSMQLTELMRENGVELLFDTVVSRPVMDGNHCKGLIVENKSGRSFYGAKMVVDVTGDADILYRAGVPTVQGENYHTFYGFGATLKSCQAAVDAGDIYRMTRVYHGGTASLYGTGHPEDMARYTGTDAEDITRYVVTNHAELLGKIKKDERKSRDVYGIPAMCQFRTTRHIDGDYTLKVEDAYRHFEDSVGAICDFDRKDYLFEIPYRTMIRSGFDNLITAGRCAAAEGYAWDILRVIPPAIISGQAAGTAAALAIDTETGIDRIDISRLQESLAGADVMIHFDDALIPADREASGEFYDLGHI